MSKLQQLLDEKWPLDEAETPENRKHYQLLRLVYEQGYNQALSDAKDNIQNLKYGKFIQW